MNLIYVTSAKYIRDYTINLTFSNGESKIVDLENYLDKPIFQPLKDKSFFKSFKLNPFTIEWDNGADFAPEFLFDIGQSIEEASNIL